MAGMYVFDYIFRISNSNNSNRRRIYKIPEQKCFHLGISQEFLHNFLCCQNKHKLKCYSEWNTV